MKNLKNEIKNKKGITKVIIAFILGAILTGGIVYAAVSASDISYTTAKNSSIKNVGEALNDLYTKSNTAEGNIYPYIYGSGSSCVGYFNFSDIRNKKVYINCRETNDLNNTSTATMYIGSSLNGNTWTSVTTVTGNNVLDVENLISTYSINTATQTYLIFQNTNYNGYSVLYVK